MKKLFVVGIVVAVLIGLTIPVFAAKGGAPGKPPGPGNPGNLVGKNWEVYNYVFDDSVAGHHTVMTPAQLLGGGVKFTIQKFESTTAGTFVIYLMADYRASLMGKPPTMTANVSWDQGEYKTCSPTYTGACVRLWFYCAGSCWTYMTGLDLNNFPNGTLTAPLADRANWFNQKGLFADDKTTVYENWMGVFMSPYDGFTNAMKSVSTVALVFGSLNVINSSDFSIHAWNTGVAKDGETGTFTLSSFTIK